MKKVLNRSLMKKFVNDSISKNELNTELMNILN